MDSHSTTRHMSRSLVRRCLVVARYPIEQVDRLIAYAAAQQVVQLEQVR